MSLYSIDFDRKYWTVPEARRWLEQHELLTGVDITPRRFRFIQHSMSPLGFHMIAKPIGTAKKPINAILAYDKSGGSLVSTIKTGLSYLPSLIPHLTRGGKTNKFKKFLDQHQGDEIVSLRVARKPVNRGIQILLNGLSGGKYRQKAKELGYDDIYHNYTIVKLKSGKEYRIERNHVVNFFPAKASDFEHSYDVPLQGKNLDMKELIEKSDTDQVYDASKTNCQDFVEKIVQKNGLESGLSHDAKELVKPQDAKALVESLGEYSWFPKLVTDSANVISHYTGIGSGLHTIQLH
jgi:hypothetical protein